MSERFVCVIPYGNGATVRRCVPVVLAMAITLLLASCGGSHSSPPSVAGARTPTTPKDGYGTDPAVCRLVPQADASRLFGADALPRTVNQPPIMREMRYCLWQAESAHGAVGGNIQYTLTVGVMPYALLRHFIAVGVDEVNVSGVGEQAIFEKLSDTGIAVEFRKSGNLVVLYYGIGPYTAANLNKIVAQRGALIDLARRAAARV